MRCSERAILSWMNEVESAALVSWSWEKQRLNVTNLSKAGGLIIFYALLLVHKVKSHMVCQEMKTATFCKLFGDDPITICAKAQLSDSGVKSLSFPPFRSMSSTPCFKDFP